jgi:hypothetical protein
LRQVNHAATPKSNRQKSPMIWMMTLKALKSSVIAASRGLQASSVST